MKEKKKFDAKEYYKKYYEQNKEKIIARAIAYRLKNPDKIKRNAKKRYQKMRQALLEKEGLV